MSPGPGTPKLSSKTWDPLSETLAPPYIMIFVIRQTHNSEKFNGLLTWKFESCNKFIPGLMDISITRSYKVQTDSNKKQLLTN